MLLFMLSMALVVFLRGVNVGGHRTFRPAALARQLGHLDAVNIGAAGTLVIRRPVTRARLRAELARRLPFETEIVICHGRDVLKLLADKQFAKRPMQAGMVRFVTVLAKQPRSSPAVPIVFPPKGRWLMKVLAQDKRFAVGVYRRHMKVIGYLGKIDGLFGVPATTRNWNTMTAIAGVLAGWPATKSAR